MSAINLEKSIQTMKKCYVGKIKGQHTVDRSKVDALSYKFAAFRINLAIKNKEMTEKELLKQLRK